MMTGARTSVVFFLNGDRCEVSGADATLTVSDFLRERRGLVGTKIVCSEGDCGSCTVLVGRPDAGGLKYLPIDSCIQFVFQLDGAHLVTVEGLSADGNLSPVQQAMVDCHGSQCGFCTPGFVMAMTGVVEECSNGSPPTQDEWREGLTGNLCRCTGYSQILEAGELAAKDEWRLDGCYPAEAIAAELAPLAEQPFLAKSPDGTARVYSPVEIEDALRFRNDNPGCCVVAGATDLGVQRNKGRVLPTPLLDLRRVTALGDFALEGQGRLMTGALATWTDLLGWSRLELPEFAKILSVFGSPQIRHAGTIGGNLMNASPIADSIPLLYAMEAELILASVDGQRVVPINDFYTDYKQYDLKPNELLTQVNMPLPASDELLRLYKVSRRKDLDISTFTAAIRMRLDGETIADAKIAYGAVGPTVLRLPETEASLIGQPFTAATMRAAGDTAVAEITPLTDVRGAADFRFQLARNVLLKFHAEHQAGLLTNA